MVSKIQFFKAVSDGDVETFRRGLKEGMNVNMTFWDGDKAIPLACRGGHEKFVDLLIMNHAYLNVTGRNGDTGLHVACRGGHVKIVELLIKNQADLNVTNESLGDIPLHVACRTGHVKVVELLIKRQADLNVTNKNGDTGLLLACRKGHEKVVELLIKNQADPDVTGRDGDTALHEACKGGHVAVVELLIKIKVDINVINENGDTGLHEACRGGHDKVVELLVRRRADLLVTNKYAKRPVDCPFGLGRGTRLLVETETRKQAEYSELVTSLGSVEETTVKLFLCGDGQVGKTSLVTILIKTGFFEVVFYNIWSWFGKEGAFNPTAGVHMSRKDVRGVGRLSLHDFAGQAQFYVTHAMLLRTTNAIFPVVYKITDGEEKQKRQVHCWLSFIHCSNVDPTNKPRIVLIASHADKLQDQKAGRRRATAIVNRYTELFRDSLVVSQEVFLMNCMEAGSHEVERLRKVIATFRDEMLRERPSIPKVCAQLMANLSSWREDRKAFPVMEWRDYLESVMQATSSLSERVVHLASSYLHDVGEIIYLGKNVASLVVLDPQWLCSFVFGRLLAPDNFPIDKVERTAQDYVTREELIRVFGAVTYIPLLIKLLQDFQLCHTYDGHTFILPSLLEQEIDEKAWSPVSSKAVYFGTQICCRTEIDSFSCDLFPRLQTLLMQAKSDQPHKFVRPLLWKNSAKCTDGKAEALLQITQDKRQLNILVRSIDGEREDCKFIMDFMMDMAFKILHETSPGARSRDMVLSALDLREHSPQPHAYSREEVEEAAAKGENVVHPHRNVPEKVTDLLLHLEHLEIDETTWSYVSNNAVYFGIQIRCCTGANSSSADLFPRLQTLLMQAHPDKLSRPLLWPWKKSAKCTDGKAEALLKMTHDKRRLNIFVRSIDGNKEDCKSIMNLLTDMTFKLVHETSPGAWSRDMVLSALDLQEHSKQPHAYSREEVEEAAAKGENVVHPHRNVPEKVTDLLLQIEHLGMDEKAWSPLSNKAVYFGIQIRCTGANSSSADLFPRLQTLLMQAHPGKLSQPLLWPWKKSAKCTDGKAEALLKMTHDKRRLNIFVRSIDGNKEDCKSIMDLLTDMTFKLVNETSPGAWSRDMVLSALDLREHSPQSHAYSREEVEEAAAKGKNVVHPHRNVPEKVTDLLLYIEHLGMDEKAWSPLSNKAVYFGIQIRCCTGANSSSADLFPRLQTLLMQAHPDKLSQPLLWPWKNSAKCTDGKAEALLQITQDKRNLNIFVRSIDGDREDCKSIMDLLIEMTYKLVHETSPGARSRDMVLSALDLREHSPQPHAYSREEVEDAAAKGENVVHPKRNVPEKVKDILLHLGDLKGMLGTVARKRSQLVETLRHSKPILDHLRQDDVINMEETDRIRAAMTPQDAARELLDILEAKGEQACIGLYSALQQTDKFAASLLEESPMSEEGATASTIVRSRNSHCIVFL